MVICCPATTTDTGRSAPVLAATLTEILASPAPLDGETDTQPCSPRAVQEQAGCVRTAMEAWPPVPSTASAVGLTVYSQGAGPCASATCRSATASEACRATGSAFSATRYATVPSPWPSTAEVKVIQLTGVEARHEHSRATLTPSVPVPPAGPNDPVELEIVASHRLDAGAVTLVEVEAELPQP